MCVVPCALDPSKLLTCTSKARHCSLSDALPTPAAVSLYTIVGSTPASTSPSPRDMSQLFGSQSACKSIVGYKRQVFTSVAVQIGGPGSLYGPRDYHVRCDRSSRRWSALSLCSSADCLRQMTS